MKQNTVYLYASGKTESFDAGFGYRSMDLELKQTLKEMIHEKKTKNLPLPITLLFVENGIIIGQLTTENFLTSK